MADVRGKECDRPGCDTFVRDATHMPAGWLSVRPIVAEEQPGGPTSFEFCSDQCNALFSIERVEAFTGKPFNRQTGARKRKHNVSEEGRAAMQESGRRRAAANKAAREAAAADGG